MSGEKKQARRSSWVLMGVACLAVYACCYLFCGDAERAKPGMYKHPATIRSYRSPLPLVFVPAAWLEANITRRTVVIGEWHGAGVISGSAGTKLTFTSLVIHKWVVDPDGSFGASPL